MCVHGVKNARRMGPVAYNAGNSGLRVLDIGLFSHSVELDQLSKGVDVYYELTDAIRELKQVIKERKV